MISTYSIVAYDLEAGQWGVAVQSRFLAALPQKVLRLLVVEKDGGYAGLSDRLVDLRVDDHERPLDELRRLYNLHEEMSG